MSHQECAPCPPYLSMPCRSLKLSFASGCCSRPALSMNTSWDGALLRTCRWGREGAAQLPWAVTSPAL